MQKLNKHDTKPLKIRLRRLRENSILRNMLSETTLDIKEIVQPLFVKEVISKPIEISSMPGQFQFDRRSIIDEAKKIESLGIQAVILFGIPDKKDISGRSAFAKNGIIQKTVSGIKKNCKKLLVITDVCLCEYLSHGHCGHIHNGRIINDASVKTLAQVALSHAQAGADIVAPSDMMDGRVEAIRSLLDKNHFTHTPIISYAVKYASSLYSPFREAAQSAPSFGDRSSYQMNPANIKEALREAETDLREGADIILVKPGMGYLDIVNSIKNKFACPVGCYSVSGEYSMIKAASQKGWLDEKRVVLETHLSMKRAGANLIITYWAKELARWLKGSIA